jgi:hypothetical protein
MKNPSEQQTNHKAKSYFDMLSNSEDIKVLKSVQKSQLFFITCIDYIASYFSSQMLHIGCN